MKLLLDTHALLWMVSDSGRLPPALAQQFAGAETTLVFSSACAWEISIKHGLGRLDLDVPPSAFFKEIIERFTLEPLSVSIAHTAAVADLPLHHRDPFDRLLVAQSIVENLPLVSFDPMVKKYPARIIDR